MRETETKTRVTCDGCKKPINDGNPGGQLKELDFCGGCLRKLHLLYMKVVEGKVPDRRGGGFRSLGDFADT